MGAYLGGRVPGWACTLRDDVAQPERPTHRAGNSAARLYPNGMPSSNCGFFCSCAASSNGTAQTMLQHRHAAVRHCYKPHADGPNLGHHSRLPAKVRKPTLRARCTARRCSSTRGKASKASRFARQTTAA